MRAQPELEQQRRQTGRLHGRVGGRSERVVKAILCATAAELARVGFAALRVEDVASQAGVNKTTVYRRWPTKLALVADALRTHVAGVMHDPHTGALRSDLVDLSRQLVETRLPEGWAITRTILAELDNPELAALVRELRENWQAPWLDVVRRAVDEGGLPRGTDPRLLVEVLTGGLSLRLRRGEVVGGEYLDAVIDLVLRGAEHGGGIVR